jgi:hypothetical protein
VTKIANYYNCEVEDLIPSMEQIYSTVFHKIMYTGTIDFRSYKIDIKVYTSLQIVSPKIFAIGIV